MVNLIHSFIRSLHPIYPRLLVRMIMLDRSKIANAYASQSNILLKNNEGVSKAVDMDLTGSPLKDDCVVEAIEDISLNIRIDVANPWLMQEECHKGINVEKARAIICKEEFQSVDPEATGSIWILCNGADAEKTLMLQYDFSPGCFNRGIVTCQGIIPTFEVNTQSLMRQHLALITRSTTAQVETYIENTYQIKPHISVRCSWSSTAASPSLVDLTSCDVTLRQSFCLSSCNELTEDFMNQLRILTVIRNDIIAYKCIDNGDADGRNEALVYRCGYGIDVDELRENISKAVTEIAGFGVIDTTESGVECDIEAVVQRVKIRRLTDLTDKLWEILKRCSSYKDLKMAFTMLFKCAAHCNIVNTPTNKNRLAEIITEVANRRLAIPCLTGTEPLELLLEIGLEKLYKDYELIFDESKICSANDLKSKSLFDLRHNDENEAMPNVRKSLRNAVRPEVVAMRKTLLHNTAKGGNKFKDEDAVGFKNSNFDEMDTAERLAKLLQVHCALEHLLMIHVNLNLSNVYSEVCEQLLRKPPRFLENIDDSLVDEIEISLSAHDVREHLEGKDPHVRRVSMRSKNKFREVKSTFFYSMDNICPQIISECFQSEEKEISKESTYYSWLYRKIKTLH
ncbi:PREDICTED: protein zwilch isoform X2 [Rhagoletis zephyria]|uniref:protein zwilch isoform X2 n=1 Tax=Rhagoletis zephyria TaxID=28612 RepID=UPI0008113C0A|nr:PREDICTED: protein zwilch isoform X2 [Rhagoletis zephyria]